VRPLADRLEPFEDLDGVGAVVGTFQRGVALDVLCGVQGRPLLGFSERFSGFRPASSNAVI
jgi:hypothetical protein